MLRGVPLRFEVSFSSGNKAGAGHVWFFFFFGDRSLDFSPEARAGDRFSRGCWGGNWVALFLF